MDADLAQQYYLAVRLAGKAHWRDGRYTDEPESDLPLRGPESP